MRMDNNIFFICAQYFALWLGTATSMSVPCQSLVVYKATIAREAEPGVGLYVE